MSPRRSNRHDLLFLTGEKLLDFGNGGIGRLLHFIGLAIMLVFADLVVLFEFFEKIGAFAPTAPPRHSRSLGIFVSDPDDLPSPLFVELGDAQPQDLPF